MNDHRKTIQTLFASNLVLAFGFQIWRAVFNNLADGMGLEAGAVGAVQSIREVPGLMGFLFVMMVALLGSEMRVMGANVLLLGVGLVFAGMAPNLPSLILGTLVTSVGFHYFYSGSQAVLLQVTAQDDTPQALGRLSSVGALAAVLATASVAGAALVLSDRLILTLGGCLVIAAGLVLLPRMNVARRYERQDRPARESARREYWLYYALSFLMGLRRHIFTTFAIFLLVRVHDLETSQTALLLLVNSVINFFLMPQLGQLVARFGERRMLTLNFFFLIGIFLGYATIHTTWILVMLFILDNIFFGFSLALSSYFQKISVTPQDIMPNMSLGQSINHIAAVTIPIVGGWMWDTFDPAMPFLTGAVVAVVSLVLMNWMRVPQREAAGVVVG